jgi:tetratricopeptide (TPR) repeat protein
MADDIFEEEEGAASASSPPGAGVDWALLAASRGKADAFLDHQSRYLELQMEDLHEQRDLTLSHLQFRRLSDWLRLSWQVLVAGVVIVAAVALVSVLIAAKQADGAVIDVFSVPSGLATQGMTGSVAAARLLDQLNRISDVTNSYGQGGGDYRGASGEEIKVDIPETGISIGEVYRYLRQWLGSETHIRADIVQKGNGLALSLRYGEAFAINVTQPDGDADALLRKAAESVFAHDRPLRFVEFLGGQGRFKEAYAAVGPLMQYGMPHQRARAQIVLGQLFIAQGDARGMLRSVTAALSIEPDDPVASAGFSSVHGIFGHWQIAHDRMQWALDHWAGPATADLSDDVRIGNTVYFRANLATWKGDFQGAAAAWRDYRVYRGWATTNTSTLVTDLCRAHETKAARAEIEQLPDSPQRALLALFQKSGCAFASSDYKAAARDGSESISIALADPIFSPYVAVFIQPDVAVERAHAGDLEGARLLADQTPADCDPCALARARVAAVAHAYGRATFWFAAVSARTPTLPAADNAWGEMLLRKGDFDAAIAKLESAHRKGPRFADPLELWGEALIAKNRSDLALSKFQEAARYAPNWGRLHLKWGEALLWLGRRTEARVQFMTASGLDLSPSDRTILNRLITAG